ncbi:MAG: response regulator, partial [Abitibacteriaceae bacterium]|nr:response regulator [Abditibacteriaceae bacterium]
MRVLIVDDNEELRGFLALCLTEAALEVVEARDAADALHKVEAEKFDALVIDSIMDDGEDGITLT